MTVWNVTDCWEELMVSACVASSVDGVIHPVRSQTYAQLGSSQDLDRLLTLRNTADAIVVGAETFRMFPSRYRGSNGHQPMLGVLTRGHDPLQAIPLSAPVFSDLAAQRPTLIVSDVLPSLAVTQQYPVGVEWISTQGDAVRAVLTALFSRGCRCVLVEGGGKTIGQFVQAQALHTLYLTLCPLLLGGGQYGARHWLEGLGFLPEEAPRLTLEAWQPHATAVGTEILTTWAVTYPPE
ncbi:MAG: dihydrofolate reductase family protein [Vampirovibrionales bacterium]